MHAFFYSNKLRSELADVENQVIMKFKAQPTNRKHDCLETTYIQCYSEDEKMHSSETFVQDYTHCQNPEDHNLYILCNSHSQV
jgi:hypothetical protein